MIAWLFGTALGSSNALEPSPAREIVWARPFELAEPARYRHTSHGRDVRRGWLVELRVEPSALVPRQIGVPLLWVGDDLAVRTNWSDLQGRVVVWVPGDHDLRQESVFCGSDVLPEQVDAPATRRELRRAEEAGIRPVPAERIGDISNEVLELPDERALLERAAARRARWVD
jgi:hypothetical protein